MELDRTEIVIRQRNSLELLDLSLLVLKKHFLQLALASSLLGLPFLVLDVWLIHWMVAEDSLLASDGNLSPEIMVGVRYTVHLIALFTIQFSMVSLPATMLVGSLVFFDSMPFGKLLSELRKLSLQWLLILGVFRLGLVPFLLEPLLWQSAWWGSAAEFWLLLVALPIALIIRAFWPFASEIVGLERCQLRSSEQSKVTYRTRSRFLHGPLQSDLFGRFVVATAYGAMILAMLVGVCVFLKGVVTGSWQWNQLFYFLVLPACLMLVGMLLTVFRYLSYIDSRIQLEGWEIDLRLRAEATRLEQQEQPRVSAGSAVNEGVAL